MTTLCGLICVPKTIFGLCNIHVLIPSASRQFTQLHMYKVDTECYVTEFIHLILYLARQFVKYPCFLFEFCSGWYELVAVYLETFGDDVKFRAEFPVAIIVHFLESDRCSSCILINMLILLSMFVFMASRLDFASSNLCFSLKFSVCKSFMSLFCFVSWVVRLVILGVCS